MQVRICQILSEGEEKIFLQNLVIYVKMITHSGRSISDKGVLRLFVWKNGEFAWRVFA